jgi:hypothetical protein
VSGESPGDAFEARLRRHFAGIDTAPGFEAHLAARLAAIHGEPADVQRARVERRLVLEAARLRREAWTNATAAAGVGAAAIVLVWRHGAAVVRGVEQILAAASDPSTLGNVAIAVLALCVWPVLQRFVPR